MEYVNVISLDRGFARYKRDLKKDAECALSFIRSRKASLDIFLVSDSRMQEISFRFYGKDKSTNVLAFTSPPEFPKTMSIEEIYLCPPYIKRHNEDIQYMLVHGILHLSGFNHEVKGDRIKMEKKEEELIAFIRKERG